MYNETTKLKTKIMNIMNDIVNSFFVDGNTITVNGKDYEIPKHVRSRFGSTTSMINGKIYVNDYRFYPETGQWKISYLKLIKYAKILMWIGIIVLFIILINWGICHIRISIV